MSTPSPANPQVQASDPKASVFVAANAGSGKTTTLVNRVARLLLAGARPEAILCVTYTKAGAAEMQRRLFARLGRWAVARDETLIEALAEIDEEDRDLSSARALFARALETPGGLKIQTIHAFCEQLLRRFPLEAGVSPGFTVMDDVAAARVSLRARDALADAAMADPHGWLAKAYQHFSVELDWASFNTMFVEFAVRRAAIAAYAERCESVGGFVNDVWRRCGFAVPSSREEIEAEALGRIRWRQWSAAADALLAGTPKTDQPLGRAMKLVGPDASFDQIWAIFSTGAGTPKARLATQSVEPSARNWLIEEQARHAYTRSLVLAACVAENTAHALTLALAYGALYEGAKGARGSLDFADLIAHAHRLLTVRADATWVLFKLDGGLEHVLLDEGQDTAPEQWDILRALTAEFFTGLGAGPVRRTVFAVADEKQSIFSFQGAAPERFAVEKQRFGTMVTESGFSFIEANLLESWRSAPEILGFVDMVFRAREALDGLRPGEAPNKLDFPLAHRARRDPAGCVDLWPLEAAGESADPDAWAPVDSEPEESANRRLAKRIARAIVAMVTGRDQVLDRNTRAMRPCGYGDMLILVRRRSALFHEIIRALKREGVPVGGADRLKLSEHGVFEDMMALARFARFTGDDLTLAGVLRGPFCDVGEESLFDLAHDREGSLWSALVRRASERPEWDGAHRFLSWARGEGSRAAPFDFFNRLMDRLDDAGRSMRQRLYTRMGAEGEDAADAFLAEALAAEDRGARDLETFIAAMSLSEIEVKREAEDTARAGEGEVRVMTVHGAKGLEAPIVILPDTSARATDRGSPLMETDDGAFLWAPRTAEDCPATLAARQRRALSAERESSRLLYVALTRARDRLILCGVESQTHRYERSWRDYMQRAFDELPIHPFVLDSGGEGWRYGLDPVAADAPAPSALTAPGKFAWIRAPAPPEPAVARFASPSTLDETARAPAPSPLGLVAGLGRFRRGDIIHRLLQMLPDLPDEERPSAAIRWLTRERDLSADQRAEMAHAALAVLGDRRFAAVFGRGSKAEVALAGTVRAIRISGRVDRLVVKDDRVLVVDFKTNRPAPKRVEDADEAYLRQMALYVVLLREVFPGRIIEAALVWTDGPKLMPVPDVLIDAALTELSAELKATGGGHIR
jgi:ATP-dependent helicase/nuclease subunit A